MFTNEMKIMLYVDDVKKNVDFWTAVGFKELDRQEKRLLKGKRLKTKESNI